MHAYSTVRRCSAVDDSLPAPLKKLRERRYLAGVGVVLISVTSAAASSDMRCLYTIVFALWFFFSGLTLRRDYSTGKIVCGEFICTGCSTSVVKNCADITLQAAGSAESIQIMRISGRKRAGDFAAGAKYSLCYVPGSVPYILAYVPICYITRKKN